jgi:hypothetical protein
MRGRLLDVGLLAVWLATFIIVAMVHPDLANAIVAWVGAMLLGWYNTLVRHNPRDDSLRAPWQRRRIWAPAAAAAEVSGSGGHSWLGGRADAPGAARGGAG